MAASITAHTNLTASSGSVNSKTISIDCTGATSLIVFVYNQVNSAGDTTGVTADGVAMTLIGTTARSDNTGRQIKAFGLHSPHSGTINIVASRSTTSTAVLAVSAYAVAGTDTSTPIPTVTSANAKVAQNTGTSVTISMGNAAGAALFAFGIFDGGGQTAGSGLTKDSSDDIVSDFRGNPFPANASQSITANAGSGTNALIGVALAVVTSTNHTKTLTETATAAATFSRLWTLARTLTEAKTATASLVKMATKRLVETVTGTDSFTKGLIVAGGPNMPATMSDDGAVGTLSWSNPNNAKVSDNTYATAAGNNAYTHYLKAQNFGFAVPVNATIVGIVAEIERKTSNAGIDTTVSIVKSDGSIGSSNKADTVNGWPFSDTYKSYGGATDLWGETWTPSDINDADFGVVLQGRARPDIDPSTLSVDHIRITVYYSQPGNSYTKALTDTATAAASIIKATTRMIAQSVTSTATFSRVWTTARSLTESATSAAALVKTLTRTAVEAVTASDSLTALRSIAATLSEGITGAASLIRSSVRRLSETATATDTFTGLRGLFPVFSEAASATASLVKTAGKRLSDTAQAAANLVRSVVRTLSEAPSAADTLEAVSARAATLTETAQVAAILIRTTTRKLSETATATASFIGAFARILADTATGTASLSAVRHYARTLSDAISASDLFSRAVTYARSFIETARAADTLRQMLNGTVVIWTNIARVVGNAFTNRSRNSTTWTDRERREEDWDNRPRNHY